MTAMEVRIFGCGAASAVGHDLAATAAAVRAGLSGFAQHRFMVDRAGEPMRVAAAPWLAPVGPLASRIEALLFSALDEVLGDVRLQGLRLALALGLPEPRPGLPEGLAASQQKAVARRYQGVFQSMAAFERGHAASLVALEAALDALRQGSADACIVAGVDSYLAPATLDWLERCDQLQGAGLHNNAWGFVPGEAAAALLLAGERGAQRLGLAPLGRVVAVASGLEPHRIKTRTVCTGAGLGAVLRRLLASRAPGALVTDVYSDMNGEPYRADEYGFAMVKVREAFRSASDPVTPADCTGDVGAAGGALHLALAAMAARKRYAAGPLALVHGGSEAGARAAALVSFD